MDELADSFCLATVLQWQDLAVLAGAVAALLLIAYLSGRRERGTQDFFVGSRSVPAAVACLAFVATEISAVSIIGVPADTFKNRWAYLQFFIGSAAARVVIALLFIPIFYRHNCTTIFEYLRDRFGHRTRYAGSAFFFLTRLLGAGVRLYAASLGVAAIMGWSLTWSIALFSVISIAFIAFGGIKAVVWTGAFETLFFYAAGGAVVVYLLGQIDGGAAGAWGVAMENHKTEVFNFSWSLADPNTFWAATIGAFFLNMSVFGTDHDFMQRLLTVKTRRSSQRALLGTIVAALPLVVTYAVLGTLLFVFYAQRPELALPQNTNSILSHFVQQSLPAGLRGLVLAAILLASIDSPLSSLSASFVTDIYRPLINRRGSDSHYLWVGRACVAVFGVLLAALACCSVLVEGIGVLWLAFEVLAVTGGSMLGVFLLGLLTRRRADRANVLAMVFTAAVSTAALVLIHTKGPSGKPLLALGWTWLVVIGTLLTFGLAWLAAPLLDGPTPPRSSLPRQHAADLPAVAG